MADEGQERKPLDWGEQLAPLFKEPYNFRSPRDLWDWTPRQIYELLLDRKGRQQKRAETQAEMNLKELKKVYAQSMLLAAKIGGDAPKRVREKFIKEYGHLIDWEI